MTVDYNFSEIEPKWQKHWADSDLFAVEADPNRPKLYCLNMFPYPSGVLHVGHGRNYILGDSVVRYKKMKGFNVLAPMGWDAFGLPAENAAIKFDIHPKKWVAENVANMKGQFYNQGICFDWRREVNTSEPEYYRWTQWVFLKLHEAGLAYKSNARINWCISCEAALANEEVVNETCERCGSAVEPRDLNQWFFRITNYAQRLVDDLDLLQEWPEKIITMQRNWIGRSEGTEVNFVLDDGSTVIPCYTTRPDTLFGVTFFSLAVEHPMIPDLVKGTEYEQRVMEFIDNHKRLGGIRGSENAEKEGVFSGRYIINPVNGEKAQLWVANYALMEYGTGGVMAVPAHDQRDFLFAKKYNLPIKVVIQPAGSELSAHTMTEAYEDPGVQVNSGSFDGMTSELAKKAITEYLHEKGSATATVKYRLRDWLISRQRYWGAPIPIIFCAACGEVPVPEEDLPVLLPDVAEFKSLRGKSPLADNEGFILTSCPKCGGPARRETDTLAQWLCSCWYFLRFASPFSNDVPYKVEDEKYWMPVDQYIGGAEHAVLHLLYTRFIVKVLYDLGQVTHKEPFKALFTQGTIVKDGAKMSKSRGNVVSPDDIISKFGADTLRLYTLFIGPPEKAAEWTDESVQGCFKFLRRLWDAMAEHADNVVSVECYCGDGSDLSDAERKLRRYLHQAIARVNFDFEDSFHFNTAIATLMELLNKMRDLLPEAQPKVQKEVFSNICLLLAPMAPHISEEMWERIGGETVLFETPFPVSDSEVARDPEIEIVVQVNGKLRGKFLVVPGTPEDRLKELALELPNVKEHVAGGTVKKIVAIKDRLVNIVVSPAK